MRNGMAQIHVKKYCTILIVVGFLFSVICILNAIVVGRSYHRLERATNDYAHSQQDIYDLKEASDYLTEMTRQYVLTGNTEYMKNYIQEITVDKRRNAAVENMKERVAITKISNTKNIDTAFQYSTDLEEKEMYAMKLISCMRQQTDVPKEIQEFQLKKDDELLTGVQMQELAYDLVFSMSYIQDKSYIDHQVSLASETFLSAFEEYKDDCSLQYKVAFILFNVFFIITVIVFILIAVTIVRFVLNPLAQSIHAIENDERIPLGRTFEINYLADIYNEVYEKNTIARLKLKEKAEQDALTGLLNRGSFDELKDYYSKTTESIALLLIDVDFFKGINDTYGHEAGDKALVKVSNLLKECFRINDFPVRFGGDEFAVIMTEITPAQRGVLMRKLIYINECLQNPEQENEPKLSVSVGVAFSELGFSDDLLERADKALYQTKENGRCGYTFWSEEMNEIKE